MDDPTQPVNPVARFADAVLRGVFSIMMPIAYAAEVAACPILGTPPLSWVFKWVQDWIANQTRLKISMLSTFLIIEFETLEERNNFSDAVKLVQEGLKKGDLNDPALLAQAAKLDAAFDKLVLTDGTFTPK